MNKNFRINEKMSDELINEMEDYLKNAGLDYEVRSVHTICMECNKFAMFTSNPGAIPHEDGYYCDNPDCDNCHCVSSDGNDDWNLNGFKWK